jgi:ubiquinone/menaquinone biosynthesis C-methylase UbiE
MGDAVSDKLVTIGAYRYWAPIWNLSCYFNRSIYLSVLGQLGEREREVLDVGCGSGVLAKKLVRRGKQVVGVDLSPAMIRRARARRLATATFVEGDAESLAFPDASFDAVVNLISIHHYPHPSLALAEFKRVLRPGGRAVIAAFHGDSRFIRFAQRINGRLRRISGVEWHKTPRELLTLAERAGFERIEIVPVRSLIKAFLLIALRGETRTAAVS